MTQMRLENNETIKRFVLAGQALFTIRSSKTGTRFTYRVVRASRLTSRVVMGQKDREPPYFVRALTGSGNAGKFAYMGLLWQNGDGSYKYTHPRNSAMSYSAPCVKAFKWTWKRVLDNQSLQAKDGAVEFWHAGLCARCGRPLTVPESIERGMGPICAQK